MKRQRRQFGFTMVETMIFLAVSTAVFAVSIAIVSEQQSRAEIRFGMEEFSGQVRDVMNDVSTGFYERPENLQCRTNPGTGTLQLNAGPANELGQSRDCIFIGRIIHFDPEPSDYPFTLDEEQVYRVFTVAGRRQIPVAGPSGDSRDVTTLVEATPRAIEDAETQSNYILPYGIRIATAKVSGTNIDAYAFGVFTRFASYENNSVGTVFESNARDVQIVPLRHSGPGFDSNKDSGDIYAATQAIIDETSTRGVDLCFESRGYRANVYIGPNGSYTANDLVIEKGDCP